MLILFWLIDFYYRPVWRTWHNHGLYILLVLLYLTLIISIHGSLNRTITLSSLVTSNFGGKFFCLLFQTFYTTPYCFWCTSVQHWNLELWFRSWKSNIWKTYFFSKVKLNWFHHLSTYGQIIKKTFTPHVR
jgi:hypothetical protein